MYHFKTSQAVVVATTMMMVMGESVQLVLRRIYMDYIELQCLPGVLTLVSALQEVCHLLLKSMVQVVAVVAVHHHHPVALHPSHPKANHPNLLLIIREEEITKELLLPKYTLITRVIPNPTRI